MKPSLGQDNFINLGRYFITYLWAYISSFERYHLIAYTQSNSKKYNLFFKDMDPNPLPCAPHYKIRPLILTDQAQPL